MQDGPGEGRQGLELTALDDDPALPWFPYADGFLGNGSAAVMTWSMVTSVANCTPVGHTETMEYIGRVPAPPLDRFIDDIYCLTGVPRYRRMNVPPMPSAHLFVNLGEPARLWDSDPSVPPAVFTDGWFMGVWTRRFLYEYPARVRLVGVHFKPWGISPFAGIPATELRDRWVPADAVWQRSLDRIRNQGVAITWPRSSSLMSGSPRSGWRGSTALRG